MKIGDKVICIDDSAGKLDGIKRLKKEKVYTVLNVTKTDVFVIPNDLSWDKRRFRLVNFEWAEKVLLKLKPKEVYENI